MMRPYYHEQSALGASNPIPLDWRTTTFQVSVGVVLSNTPSLTFAVEYTLDPILDPTYTGTPTWIKFNDADNESLGVNFAITSPVIAIRLNILTYTSGTARLQIVTAG